MTPSTQAPKQFKLHPHGNIQLFPRTPTTLQLHPSRYPYTPLLKLPLNFPLHLPLLVPVALLPPSVGKGMLHTNLIHHPKIYILFAVKTNCHSICRLITCLRDRISPRNSPYLFFKQASMQSAQLTFLILHNKNDIDLKLGHFHLLNTARPVNVLH